MKKAFVIGMVALSTTMSFSAAHAATTGGAKSAREMLIDYTKQVKENAFGNKNGSAKGISTQQAKVARDRMINELNLPSGVSNSLSIALTSDSAKATQRLESLATVVAAKKMAAKIAEQDAAEGKSLDEAATASAKLLANSSLTGVQASVSGSRGAKNILNEAEMKEATAALDKLETLPEAIMTRFNKSERDSYTQILERHNQIVEAGSTRSSEEALIQAIMDVKKIDKSQALEIAKKLKECV